MILLDVQKKDKDKVKGHLGVTYLKNQENPYRDNFTMGCWTVNDEEDTLGELYKFRDFINPKEVMETTLAELCKMLSKDIKVIRKAYAFTADVNNIYNVGENKSYYIFTLISEHNYNRIIKAKVPKAILWNTNYEEFIDKEVEVEGAFYFYAPYNELQFEVIDISIIGLCTRHQEINFWRTQCIDLIQHKTEAPTFNELIEKIGVISNRKSQGYKDFDKVLTSKIDRKNIILKDITMNVNSMIQAIEELNQENECQVICIVRGGGNPESLIDFSRPELLRAIHDSKIPVIIGVGHVNDQLLCNEVAFWYTETPTAAAEYINRQRKQFKDRMNPQKDQVHSRKDNEWKAGISRDSSGQSDKYLQQIKNLRFKIKQLEGNLEKARDRNTELKKENVKLQGKNTNLTKENAVLTKENESLHDTNKTLDEKNRKLEEKSKQSPITPEATKEDKSGLGSVFTNIGKLWHKK